jgi:hypothetical protein
VSESSPADPSGTVAALVAPGLAVASLWAYASASSPEWLAGAAVATAIIALVLAGWSHRQAQRPVRTASLFLALVVLTTELAATILSRT